MYVWKDVTRLPIVVVDEVPFTLEIVEPKVPLVRNGSMQLKIVATRKEGFKAPIQVQLPFRPPGMGAASSATIGEGQTEVLYPISANGGAQIKDWKIYVIGSANVGGSAWVSSQLAELTIAAPYVTIEPQRASCEQGQPAQIYCKLNHATPFEGEAKVSLVGIPPKITAEPLTFTKDTTEVTFEVKTEAGSPAGQAQKHYLPCGDHATRRCPLYATAGVTELQIDKPLPPPEGGARSRSPKPEAKPAPKPAPKPQAKPLSRLEKLRQAAQGRQNRQRKDSKTQANVSRRPTPAHSIRLTPRHAHHEDS